MSQASGNVVGAVTPDEAWEALAENPDSLLVDVRTRPEWAFVGGADVSSLGRPHLFIEWLGFPDMAVNRHFLDMLDKDVRANRSSRLYFLCRSGARSHDAAVAAAQHFAARGETVECFNIVEGFEGPLDRTGHRGTVAGWKARGLPWRQN